MSAIEKKIRQLLPVLSEKYKVLHIGYFGSFARGDQTSQSDVDILVDFSEPLGWEFFDLQMFLEKELGREIDLVTRSAIKETVREDILKEVKYIV